MKADDFVVNNEDYFDRSSVVVADEELFQHGEIEAIVKSCPNGRPVGLMMFLTKTSRRSGMDMGTL